MTDPLDLNLGIRFNNWLNNFKIADSGDLRLYRVPKKEYEVRGGPLITDFPVQVYYLFGNRDHKPIQIGARLTPEMKALIPPKPKRKAKKKPKTL